jgi:hypothetical protein
MVAVEVRNSAVASPHVAHVDKLRSTNTNTTNNDTVTSNKNTNNTNY